MRSACGKRDPWRAPVSRANADKRAFEDRGGKGRAPWMVQATRQEVRERGQKCATLGKAATKLNRNRRVASANNIDRREVHTGRRSRVGVACLSTHLAVRRS